MDKRMTTLLLALGGLFAAWWLFMRKQNNAPLLQEPVKDMGVIVPLLQPTVSYTTPKETPTVDTSTFKLANPQPPSGAPAFTVPAKATLGIRSHNPGNIRPGTDKWKGVIGQTNVPNAGYYLVFQGYEWGIRALYRNLITYRDKYGLKTVRGIITRWAPPNDNNPTASYITGVAKAINVTPDAVLTLAQYPALIKAIIQHENGSQPYTDAQIHFGINLP